MEKQDPPNNQQNTEEQNLRTDTTLLLDLLEVFSNQDMVESGS